MASSNLVRIGGGTASVAAGLLLLVGHLASLGGDAAHGTALGSGLVYAAHALLVFALMALYAAQAERGGALGTLAMVLSVLGTTLNCSTIFVELAVAAGQDVGTVVTSGPTGTLTLAGGLAFFIGLILLGVATIRAGVFPQGAGLMLIAGDLVFAVGSVAGSAGPPLIVAGAALTCAAFVWLGGVLLRGAGRRRVGAVRPSFGSPSASHR